MINKQKLGSYVKKQAYGEIRKTKGIEKAVKREEREKARKAKKEEEENSDSSSGVEAESQEEVKMKDEEANNME